MSRDALDRFRLRTLEQGPLTGAAIGVNAVSDALLIQHIGVGCKHKTTSQLATHDTGRRLAAETGWTEVGDRELIEGANARLGPYTRSWVARRDPAIVYVVTVTFIALTGDEAAAEVEALDAMLDVPVVLLNVLGFEGDLYSGYAHFLERTLARADWRQTVSRPDAVALLGYLYDRHEGDHDGNLAVLGSLFDAIGVGRGPVSLCGGPVAEVLSTPSCGTLVALPYLSGTPLKRVARKARRPVTAVPLPMSLRGTDAFLRAVGAAAGADAARVERVILDGRAAVRAPLEIARTHLEGLRLAVIADPPLAAGWVALLGELGVDVPVVGLRGRTLGGREALDAALAQIGASLPAQTEVLEDPSLVTLRDTVGPRLDRGLLDGVVGSATDHNALTARSPVGAWSGWAGRDPEPVGWMRIEAGFPCKTYHCARPMPFLGYEGALVQAQRLLDAPRVWDAGRARPRA